MADDQLRMQAVITDGYTAPLAKLRNELRTVGNIPAGRLMARDFKSVEKSVSGVISSMKTGLGPVMRTIGVGSLGLTAGIAGAVIGLRSFANSTRDLTLFSHQIGLGVEKLREMKTLGEFFGISWESAQGSLKTFAGNLDQLKRHWGEAYNQLRGMNLSGLAEDLAKAPDMSVALEKALEGIRNIQNPVRRRQVAELLLGSDQWAVVAAEASPKVRKSIQDMLKALPEGSAEAAQKFALDMLKIKMQLENLKTQGLGPLLPEVERFFEILTKPSKDGSAGLVIGFLGGVKDALKGINDVLTAIDEGKWEKIFKVGPDREKAIIERLNKNQPNAQQGELERKADALATLEGRLAQKKGRGEGAAALEAQRDRLRDEVEKLRKAIEEANRNALLNKTSFAGGMSGAGGIINALYSGGGASRGGGIGGSGSAGGIGGSGSAGGIGGSNSAGGMPGAGSGVFGNVGKGKRAVAQAAAEEMRKAGLGDRAIAGIFANVQDESAFNPNLRHPDQPRYSGEAHYAHGLFQEGGAEWNRYAGWLQKHYAGADWRDPKLQTRFLMENLKSNYPKLWNRLQHAGSSSEAAQAFVQQYLKPARRFMMGRSNKYARGVPGVHAYTGNEEAAAGGAPLPKAAPREIRPIEPPGVTGSAKIDIHLHGLPGGSKVRSKFDGMFREINIHRGRPMQSVWDQGAA